MKFETIATPFAIWNDFFLLIFEREIFYMIPDIMLFEMFRIECTRDTFVLATFGEILTQWQLI